MTVWQLYKRVSDKLTAVQAKYKKLGDQVDQSNMDEVAKRQILMILWAEEQDELKPYQAAVKLMGEELGI